MLDPRIEKRIRESYEEMRLAGDLMSKSRLDACYSLFRSKFGPDALRQLHGEQLLETMYSLGGKDSLVYWLEFKNDDEFPSPRFGSISGGSAHKLGIFKRKATGVWTTGSPQKPIEISVTEAVEMAERNRDQLIQGSELIAKLPQQADDDAYAQLQSELDEFAPDVSNLAWGRKYFSLLYPDKIDDFHAVDYHKFNLIKLLERPPEGYGRYLSAGKFIRLAHHFSWPIHYLTSVLFRMNGRLTKTWIVDSGTPKVVGEPLWPFMRENNCLAIEGRTVGDLSDLIQRGSSRKTIAKILKDHFELTNSRQVTEIFHLTTLMQDGEIVLVTNGDCIQGIGRVASPYTFDSQSQADAPHQRGVEWLSLNEFVLPSQVSLRHSVQYFSLRHSLDNLIEIERRLLDSSKPSYQKPDASHKLHGIAGQIQTSLERKGQVILYGPPGTGKTFWARQTGFDLVALNVYGKTFKQLNTEEQRSIERGEIRGLFRMCTFHPAYGYEDFIEGFRPTKNEDGTMQFELQDGVFKQVCSDAEKEPESNFYLLIDEINRGDIPRIFGELLTLLEKDKRGQSVNLAVSQDVFSVPKNVKIIGTMNTADRSIALLDTALRRRFGFIELMPEPDILRGTVIANSIPLGEWLAALNERIRDHVGRDARNLQIGHSYFMHDGVPISDVELFVQVLKEDVLPLVEEYCYEDYPALAQILGEGLVDKVRQRFRMKLFENDRRDELLEALLEPSPELATSPELASRNFEGDEDLEEDGDSNGDPE